MSTYASSYGFISFSPEDETQVGFALLDLLDTWSEASSLDPTSPDLIAQLLTRAGFTCSEQRTQYGMTSITVRLAKDHVGDVVPLLHFLATLGVRISVHWFDDRQRIETTYNTEAGCNLLTETVRRYISSADPEVMAAHAHWLANTDRQSGAGTVWVAQELAWTA